MTWIERLHREGILRLGSKNSGFRYRLAGGGKPRADDLRRIRSLGIPPAWRKVAISRSPNGRLQAVGLDAKGRWQYRYHPRVAEIRDEHKLERLIAFGRALPRLRKRIRHDLRTEGPNHDRVMAALARILSVCFMRPGSRVYERENGSHGLCTLLKRQVHVKGDLVTFDFLGKSKQRQHREHRGHQTAKLVRELMKLPGKYLFQYVTDDGQVVAARRSTLNAYIKEVMGRDFTAKDFRTWAGTLICACALARAAREPAASMTARKKLVRQAIVETAQYLGNTPAVAKSSYVSSTVLRHFEEGRVVARFFESVEQMANCKPSVARACELALVRLLRDQKDHRKDVHPHLTKLGKVLMAGSRETLQAMH